MKANKKKTCCAAHMKSQNKTEQNKNVRTPGIEPGTIRYLRNLQSNALPTELCSVLHKTIPIQQMHIFNCKRKLRDSTLFTKKLIIEATAKRFEPSRAGRIGFRVRILTHSDTVPFAKFRKAELGHNSLFQNNSIYVDTRHQWDSNPRGQSPPA